MTNAADIIDPLLMEVDVSPTKGAFTVKKAFLYLGTLWVKTCNEVRYDLRTTRWRRSAAAFFTWVSFATWTLGVFALCLAFPLGIMRTISLESTEFWDYCAPDGSFSLTPTSPWNIAWTFQIVLGFGSLTFTKAKVVDIAWDIGVGRSGQTILAYFSWKAFSIYVRTSMERAPITYRTFWTSFMQKEASFRSIIRLIRDFTSRRGLQSKTAMVFMVATMIFVMAFPTLASAMTGYTASNEAVMGLDDGTQVLFHNFQLLEFNIHDGSRVNLSADYQVYNQSAVCGDPNPDCIDEYLDEYGSCKKTVSSWYGVELPKPTLNITAYKMANTPSFLYGNSTYPLSYIKKNGVCQPVMAGLQQIYQWGFSIIQLEVTLILLTIWTFGVWIMWLSAHLKLASRGNYEVPHEIKAALYLSDAIRVDFKSVGEEPDSLANEELRRHTREHLRGGRVEIQAPPIEDHYSLRRISWHWLKNNKIWSLAFLYALTTCGKFVGNLLLVLTMSFAMAAGWGRKTRAVFAWLAFIIATLVSRVYWEHSIQ